MGTQRRTKAVGYVRVSSEQQASEGAATDRPSMQPVVLLLPGRGCNLLDRAPGDVVRRSLGNIAKTLGVILDITASIEKK